MEKLTKREEEILNTIKKELAKNKYPPSIREIGKEVGLKISETIYFHINKLIEKGYLKKEKDKKRSLKLLVDNEYEEKNNEIKILNNNNSINIENIYIIKADIDIKNIKKDDILIVKKEDNIKENDIVIVKEKEKYILKEYNNKLNNIIGKVKGIYKEL